MSEQQGLFERVAQRAAELVREQQATPNLTERGVIAVERMAAAQEDQARALWCLAGIAALQTPDGLSPAALTALESIAEMATEYLRCSQPAPATDGG